MVARTVPTISVSTLLHRHRVERVDVLQVDAEGFDAEVVDMFVGAGVLPAIIRYEHANLSIGQRRRCVALLEERGYRFAFQDIDAVALRAPGPGE